MPSLKTFISIHKSVKVRPTKQFFLLLFGIISLFAQAYMHNYNIVYIMMFFLVSVAGTSTYFGMKNLHPLEVAFASQERCFAFEKGVFSVAITNKSDYALYDLDFSYQTQHHKISRLEANQRVHLHFELLAKSRGHEQIDFISVSSLFPLSHEIKSRNFLLNKELLIYPKPEGVSLFDSLGMHDAAEGDMGDFKALERFEQGESLSRVNWASLAKSETLMKKEFSYESKQKSLYFDFERLGGETESRLSQLTLWILECESHDFAFTLSLSKRLYDSKVEGVDGVLSLLALYEL